MVNYIEVELNVFLEKNKCTVVQLPRVLEIGRIGYLLTLGDDGLRIPLQDTKPHQLAWALESHVYTSLCLVLHLISY